MGRAIAETLLIGPTNVCRVIHHELGLIPMLDTDQLRSFLAIVDTGLLHARGRAGEQDPVGGLDACAPARGAARLRIVRQAGPRRRVVEEGEKLIDFARRMMQIEAGALAALSRKGSAAACGSAYRTTIPNSSSPIFCTRFCQRHPLVEISVVCDASISLAAPVNARALDLAVVTDTEGMKGVEIIREEQLVWVASKRFQVDPEAPLPLALSSTICQWRKAGEEALRACNRATRPLLASNNYSAIAPVVRAGLAATILPAHTVPADFRVLGPEFKLPRLPMSRMGLIHAPGHQSQEAAALADAIRATVGDMKPASAAA